MSQKPPATDGICHLCDRSRPLEDSHIWPKLLYKRYTSDQTAGGGALHLDSGKLTSKQHTRPMLCKCCETEFSRYEDEAARLCDRIRHAPRATQRYGPLLYPFAVSLAWRVTAHLTWDSPPSAKQGLAKARARWKTYLRWRSGLQQVPQKLRLVSPYSLHLFIVHSEDVGWHKALGGDIYSSYELLVMQAGPLFMLAKLGSSPLRDAADRSTLMRSEVAAAGGEFMPVSETKWRVGHNITIAGARVFADLQRRTTRFAVECVNASPKLRAEKDALVSAWKSRRQ